MDVQILLAAFASIIIIALAFYAGMLISRIKKQKMQLTQAAAEKAQQVALKNQQRNDNICESIRFIARATTAKQCNISEAAIRLSVLLETLLVAPKIDIDTRYPAISALFEKVKDFATHADRKNMDKKTIKQQDKQRKIYEDELEAAILKEAESLKDFSI